MFLKDRYLVVVSLTNGRKFPKRANCHLVAEAKFDGEVLTTDPVSHTDSPNIEQELAWEMDKKSLTQHRLQRSSIKIQLYAVDGQSPVKEAIGYIMLDLRSASTDKTYKWYPLLHSKYSSRNRPEFYVGLFLDNDGQEVVPEGMSALASSIDPSLLRPVFKQDKLGGYYQIGPDKICHDMFILSITPARASNLSQLISSEMSMLQSCSETGFYFHYNLLGNVITTEPFNDLMSADFTPERSNLRIRSTVDLLRVFLEKETPVDLHLCCGDQSLGSCRVPLLPLTRQMDHAFKHAAVVDNVYILEPAARNRQKLESMDDAQVAVSLCLRRESVSFNSRTARPFSLPDLNRSDKRSEDDDNISLPGVQPSPTQSFVQPVTRGYSPPVRDGDVDRMQSNDEGPNYRIETSTPLTVTYQDEDYGHDMRKFCFTVELRSVKNLAIADNTKLIFARYSYPMFGSSAPILTHPPITIRRNQEVTLPQGYCAFEFGATLKELRLRLANNPLVIDILSRERTKDSDNAVGRIWIDMSSLLTNRRFPKKQVGKPCVLNLQSVANILQVIPSPEVRRSHEDVSQPHNERVGEKVGELNYALSIEDQGPMPLPHANLIAGGDLHSTKTGSRQRRRSGSDVDARATLEYRAALELETWKETEEAKFREQLKQKEKQQMLSLAEEWRKRDKEREMITRKRIAEYQELEDTLRSTVNSLNRRERQLAAGEAELNRLRADLESEHKRKMAEMKEASKRLSDDCAHKVSIETEKAKYCEQQAKDWQSKYTNLDRDFSRYKEKFAQAPESRLQADLGLAHMEKAELERKLEACIKSKLHYKQMWARALKEMAKLKQREEETAREQLKRQEAELEHMRLRYLTSEETGLAGVSSVQLGKSSKLGEFEEIKKEIEKLRQDSARQTDDISGHVGFDDATEEHLARLIEERDSLLKTGVYSMEDEIIVDLDKEIRRCIAQRENNSPFGNLSAVRSSERS